MGHALLHYTPASTNDAAEGLARLAKEFGMDGHPNDPDIHQFVREFPEPN
jgi:hypothetical protein